jgi:hypothetical protein
MHFDSNKDASGLTPAIKDEGTLIPLKKEDAMSA